MVQQMLPNIKHHIEEKETANKPAKGVPSLPSKT